MGLETAGVVILRVNILYLPYAYILSIWQQEESRARKYVCWGPSWFWQFLLLIDTTVHSQ